MDTFPAAFPLRVSEEAAKDLGVEIAFAIEIAVEAAVGEARAGHDLIERHTLKAMAIEELAGAVNDVFLDCRAVTSGVRHGASFLSRRRSMPRTRLPFPEKDYLEHILARWCDAGGRAVNFGGL